MLGLTRQERAVFWFLAVALVVGAALNTSRKRALERQAEDPEIEAFLQRFFELSREASQSQEAPSAAEKADEAEKPFRVDLNTATAADLQKLPRVGPVTAQRILELREKKGGFSRVEELLEVRGIGPKTLERIRPFVYVGAEGKP